MLQKQSVSPKLLELLSFLMKAELFKDFVLVGGTSLALQLGHRNSIDIDLFGQCNIDEVTFRETVSEFGTSTLLKKSKSILIFSIEGIKVDFVHYPYPWLAPCHHIENLRLADMKDIAAMKLNAISGRGSKKDFIDLYFLLKYYSLEEMMRLYQQKYADGSEFLVLKSLTYFDDADKESMPLMHQTISWEAVKKEIGALAR